MNTSTDVKEAARRLFADRLAGGWTAAGLWTYSDASGTPLFYRARLDPPPGSDDDKLIRPFHLNGDGWRLGEPVPPASGKPLFRLHELLGADVARPVWIVEGEKCADALVRLGLIATTSGSASSASTADWTPLRGRHCIVWPDHDEAGARYAGDVRGKLEDLAERVETLDVSALELPNKGDCVDWLAVHSGATAAEVGALPRLPARVEVARDTGSVHSPEPLPDELPEVPVFPLEALPDALRPWIADVSDRMQCPPDFVAVPQLVAAASLVARHVAIRPQARYEPAVRSLWTALLAF